MTSAPAVPRAGGARHRGAAAWVLAAVAAVSVVRLLAAVTVVKAAGLASWPQRGLDEGVSIASAAHLLDAGWPGPPLGGAGPLGAPALWQLAGLAGLAAGLGLDVLDAAPSTVAGGRQLVLPLAVLGAGLLWVLAHRAGLGGGGAAVAVVTGALSPLALCYQRVVTPEVLALPWALGGLALLAVRPARTLAGEHSSRGGHPRPSPAAALAGSALLGVAAATSPLTLLLLPLALASSRGGLGLAGGHLPGPGGRRRPGSADGARVALAAAGGALVLAGAVVGSRAAGSLDAGLVPGPRGSSGLATSTSGVRAVVTWGRLDVVVPLLVVVLAVAAVKVAAWRAHALAAVLPVIAVAALDLPAAAASVVVVPWALLVAAGAVHAVGAHRHQRRPALLAAAVVLVVGAGWVLEGRAVAARSDDTAAGAAVAWLARSARGEEVLADPSTALDLRRLGIEALTPLGPDGRVPAGASGASWLVETSSVREAARRDAPTRRVLAAAVVARVFGTGAQRVAVLALAAGPAPPDAAPPDAAPPGAPPDLAPPDAGPDGPTAPQPTEPQPTPPQGGTTGVAADQRAVAALRSNPSITFSPAAARALAEQPVDVVLLAVLATAALDHRLSVADVPATLDAGPGALRATAVLDAVDGAAPTDPGVADDVLADLTARGSSALPDVEVTTEGSDGTDDPVAAGGPRLVLRLPPTPPLPGSGLTTAR